MQDTILRGTFFQPGFDGVPDSLRFLLIVACLGGAGYGAVWALANNPPEKTEIVKPLSNVTFDQ